MSRYINPYTGFGFKKLFGEEANKDLLIDFLNAVLPLESKTAMVQGQGVVLSVISDSAAGTEG